MKWPARLLCTVRGGHRWETVEDPAGSFKRCGRCGTLEHEHERDGVPNDERWHELER